MRTITEKFNNNDYNKQKYRYFEQQTSEISHEGSIKRETESLLIAVQNNAIRTNNVKAEIDKTQQNSKCRLCSDWDETFNYISERNK